MPFPIFQGWFLQPAWKKILCQNFRAKEFLQVSKKNLWPISFLEKRKMFTHREFWAVVFQVTSLGIFPFTKLLHQILLKLNFHISAETATEKILPETDTLTMGQSFMQKKLSVFQVPMFLLPASMTGLEPAFRKEARISLT